VTLRTRLVTALFAVAGVPVLAGTVLLGGRGGTALAATTGASGLLGAVVAGWLAHRHGRRLADLARTADRVAEGDLSARSLLSGRDEAGRLAVAFNRMAHRTQSYVQALTASRDQLRQHLAVLGDTLSSTHDLDRILRVILRTAVAASGAGSGAVLLLDHEASTLVGHYGGVDARVEPITVPIGGGMLGSVATTGEPRMGRVATDGIVLHEAEPRCRTYVVVPISASGGMTHAAPWPALPTVRGVLALYDRLGGDEFDDSDLATLRTFAGQAAVAVDNVRTHEEAQRLSLTDPLTGLWNYRYLEDSMRREVERASRFGHNLAVLALDLDRFKEVNDAHGHPAGDQVLVEFARRISQATREVDLAFRQGGEEFVVLLPETDAVGAAVLAQRLGAAVRREPVQVHSKLSIDVTVSIGIAVYPEHALTPRAVLDAADSALYAAKAAGRDTYRTAQAASAPVAVAELPVPANARSPADDLPQAGAKGRRTRPGPPRQKRSG
jgi:two-component system cell cycle response regulator